MNPSSLHVVADTTSAEELVASDRQRAAELEVGLASIGALFVARVSKLASIASELIQTDLELAVVNDRLRRRRRGPSARDLATEVVCGRLAALHTDLPWASSEAAGLAAEQLCRRNRLTTEVMRRVCGRAAQGTSRGQRGSVVRDPRQLPSRGPGAGVRLSRRGVDARARGPLPKVPVTARGDLDERLWPHRHAVHGMWCVRIGAHVSALSHGIADRRDVEGATAGRRRPVRQVGGWFLSSPF